jgi:hypothetical protein
MFDLDVDSRISAWAELRKKIEISEDPFQDTVDFWSASPFTAFNHHIDPFYVASWPTPWEIIVENKYDDFTRAVMIGYTLLLTDRYKNSNIQIKTLVDIDGKKLYNVVYVDELWVLNYKDAQVVSADKVPSLYNLENLVELKRPR